MLARNIITLLLYEATADLPVTHGKVQTPLTEEQEDLASTIRASGSSTRNSLRSVFQPVSTQARLSRWLEA